MRDFSKLSYVDFYAVKDELLTPVLGLQSIPRAEKRKIEFMQKTFKIFQNIQEMNEVLSIKSDKKRIIFRYLLSPTKINGLNGSVSSVEYQPNVLTIKDGIQIAAKKTNAQLETIHTQLFIKSVGYKSIKIDESILFDPIKNIIPNKEGKILKVDNTIERGKYVAGWIKTGPKGTIANTFNDCEETIANILADIENNELEEKNYNLGKEINFKKVFMPRIKIFLDAILDLLKKKDLKFYSFDDWKLIDEYEKSMGLKIGKPREKIITIDELENVLKLIKI